MVERQQALAGRVEVFRIGEEPQHPAVAVALAEPGVGEPARRHVDEVLGIARRPALVGTGGGDVEDRREGAVGIEHRRHGAGQVGILRAEVVGAVHGQRPAGDDAGADAVRPLGFLRPHRAEIEAGGAMLGVERGVVEEIEGDAVEVGEQHAVADRLEVPVEVLEDRPRDPHQGRHRLAEILELGRGQDARALRFRRIEPVLRGTSLPGIDDQGSWRKRWLAAAVEARLHVPRVRRGWRRMHHLSSSRAVAASSGGPPALRPELCVSRP